MPIEATSFFSDLKGTILWHEALRKSNENYNKTLIILNRSCKSPAVYGAAVISEKIVFLEPRYRTEKIVRQLYEIWIDKKTDRQVTRSQFNSFRCLLCERESDCWFILTILTWMEAAPLGGRHSQLSETSWRSLTEEQFPLGDSQWWVAYAYLKMVFIC